MFLFQVRGELDAASIYVRLGLPRAVYCISLASLASSAVQQTFKQSRKDGLRGGEDSRGGIRDVGVVMLAILPAASLIVSEPDEHTLRRAYYREHCLVSHHFAPWSSHVTIRMCPFFSALSGQL